jgi:hypothetical protein
MIFNFTKYARRVRCALLHFRFMRLPKNKEIGRSKVVTSVLDVPRQSGVGAHRRSSDMIRCDSDNRPTLNGIRSIGNQEQKARIESPIG